MAQASRTPTPTPTRTDCEPGGLNVLLVPLGTEGDVYPFVGLGIALKARGHRVVLIANERFRPLAECNGLLFAAAGTAEEHLAAISNRHLLTRPVLGALPLRDWFCRPIAPQYEAIAENADPGNTVIVAAGFASAARFAHEKLGIPWVLVALHPIILPVMAQIPNVPAWLPQFGKRLGWRIGAVCGQWIMGRYVNALRARLELPSIAGLPPEWWLSPTCVIGVFPEWFGEPLRTWEIETHLTGFVMYDGCTNDTLPADAETFLREGDPPIVFSPGSGMMHAAAFFRAAVDACSRLRRRGLLLTPFIEQVPKQLPANVRHFDYLPFGALLPRAAAIVHHGGIGSTAHALEAGLPQLVMPRIYDQPDNAKRIKRLGVGDWLRPIAFRGPAVARRLSKLLDSPEVARRCADVAGRFDKTHSLNRACELVEQAASVANP